MGGATNMRTLLIGTTAGLFETAFTGDSFVPEAKGFAGNNEGAIRAPIVRDVHDPDRLYVSTVRSGIWRSDDRGCSWTEKNNGLTYKEVWWIEQHPMTGELYAGTGPVAIFRSRDQAEHWEEIEELRSAPGRADWFLHIPPYFARVRTISLSPQDPNIIYGAIEEGWLIRSFDGGKSWENLRDVIGHDSHVAAVVPNNHKRVLAATFQGVFLSDDAGDTFTKREQFDTNYVTELNVHPLAPDRVYGAGALNMPGDWRTEKGADSRMYVSDDAGSTWSRFLSGLPDSVHGGPRAAAVDPLDPDVYLVGTTDGDIWMTRDGGHSCSMLGEGLPGWVTSLTILN
jgi:photosystem II stability/assembly factor-like uncharacterized protein